MANVQTACPKCGVFNEIEEVKCWKCKRPISDEEREQARDALLVEKNERSDTDSDLSDEDKIAKLKERAVVENQKRAHESESLENPSVIKPWANYFGIGGAIIGGILHGGLGAAEGYIVGFILGSIVDFTRKSES